MKKWRLEDIHLRDPFILADPEAGKYYLYGTIGKNAWSGRAIGFDVYESNDLAAWQGPIEAFRPEPDFWSDRHYWAPEVFKRGERYYMFASFKSEERHRTTGVLAAHSPLGPFQPLSFSLTPEDWECLDGTLFEEADGSPWMVFCREWLQVTDGEIYAVRLTEDLKAMADDPVLLFKASEASWSKGSGDQGDRYVTDGPFLHRLSNGALLMLWSTGGEQGYTMGTARSASGTVIGPWVQDAEPLFGKDGGHGMLFRALDDRLLLTIHTPNEHPHERPVILEVSERAGQLAIRSTDGAR